MIGKIRDKLLAFVESDKDRPFLAGFSVGLYVILFYYARNFGLANSSEQFIFFLLYFVLFPSLALLTGYGLLKFVKLGRWKKQFLFTGMIAFFSLFLLQINYTMEHKKIILPAIVLTGAIISLKFSRYYKFLMLLLFIMSVFNVWPLAAIACRAAGLNDDWRKQPDGIENVVFRQKPNIYYIQPDGYASFRNLRDSIHKFDNSAYEDFLKKNGFTLYEDYRSNYGTTLLSNAATFSMAHHHIAYDVEIFKARELIVGDNPVLNILRKNGYKTNFITESPYLIMNRPPMGYDYCNISYEEMPYMGQGSGELRDIFADLKLQIPKNGPSGNFYFLEKFTPGHIANNEPQSAGMEEEKKAYLSRIMMANKWLTDVVSYIMSHDNEAIIIIGADHGGYVGFDYMGQSETLTTKALLAKSAFGAQLSIRWGSSISEGYDERLTSSVNLFRTVFAFLAKEKHYLDHFQEDGSYIKLQNPERIYKYIDGNGKVVLEKQDFR